MFEAIQRIRRIIDKSHPRGHLPYGVGAIQRAIVEVTAIDCVRFCAFHDDDPNPVWGRYRRYTGEIAPYAGSGCIVEIDYNKALENTPWWLRFVATKEMCQALETDPTIRVKSAVEYDNLIKALRADHSSELNTIYPPFQSEMNAQVCALELLCPLRDRKRILIARQTTEISDMALAKEFWIPVDFVPMLFDPAMIPFSEAVFGKKDE